MIVIIDYGIGNLRSVQKALQHLGYPAIVSKSKAEVKNSSGIILPGVGAFDAGISELRKTNLESTILEEIALKKPFLGICLGMQLLFASSDEGKEKGLSVIKGSSKRFSSADQVVPQMGWNRLIIKKPSKLLEGISTGAMMYFAHSYYAVPEDASVVAAETDYGVNYPSAVAKENIFGVQFHPEKSADAGLKILKNFGDLCEKGVK
jgi:glutamine amidotransferase